MQTKWLKQSDADEIIVIFGGWALGPAPFAHLTGPQDVLFVDDFRSLAPLPDLSHYHRITVVAYSFGVTAFCHWRAAHDLKIDHCVAINGSPAPIDRKQGIPPVIFQRTHNGLTQDSYQDFRTLCFGAAQPEQIIDVDACKEELAAVQSRGPAAAAPFDKVILSTQDRIFPIANLRRAWADHAPIEIEAPHVPFQKWTSWDEVL